MRTDRFQPVNVRWGRASHEVSIGLGCWLCQRWPVASSGIAEIRLTEQGDERCETIPSRLTSWRCGWTGGLYADRSRFTVVPMERMFVLQG
jgi:hypothetical protein